MEPIRPLWEVMPLTRTAGSVQNRETTGALSSFAGVFRGLIDNVKETNAKTVELETLMATGELDNPALISIAQEKELAATQLLVQIRNSAVEAYNELMRISL